MGERSRLIDFYHDETGKKVRWLRAYCTWILPLLFLLNIYRCYNNWNNESRLYLVLFAILAGCCVLNFIMLLQFDPIGYYTTLSFSGIMIAYYLFSFIYGAITISRGATVEAGEASIITSLIGMAMGIVILVQGIVTVVAVALYATNIVYFVKRRDLFMQSWSALN